MLKKQQKTKYVLPPFYIHAQKRYKLPKTDVSILLRLTKSGMVEKCPREVEIVCSVGMSSRSAKVDRKGVPHAVKRDPNGRWKSA